MEATGLVELRGDVTLERIYYIPSSEQSLDNDLSNFRNFEEAMEAMRTLEIT